MPVERMTSSASTSCYRHPSRRRIVGVSLKMYFDYARTQTYARGLLQCANMHPNFPIADHQGTQALDIFVLPDCVFTICPRNIVSIDDALVDRRTKCM